MEHGKHVFHTFSVLKYSVLIGELVGRFSYFSITAIKYNQNGWAYFKTAVIPNAGIGFFSAITRSIFWSESSSPKRAKLNILIISEKIFRAVDNVLEV